MPKEPNTGRAGEQNGKREENAVKRYEKWRQDLEERKIEGRAGGEDEEENTREQVRGLSCQPPEPSPFPLLLMLGKV